MIDRIIDLRGVFNARELGGYKTFDGKTVKEHSLIRTGALVNISEESKLELINKYKLKYIVDLRTDSEVDIDPDPVIGEAENKHFSVLGNLHIDKESYEIYKRMALTENIGKRYLIAYSSGLDFKKTEIYRSFVFSDCGKKAYMDYFDVLLSKKDDESVLFHCTQGKDRTGMAAILTLSALNVPRKTYVEDYMLTNEACSDIINEIKKEVPKLTDNEAVLELALFCESVDLSSIRPILKEMDEKYGGVKGYIANELKLSDAAFQKLRVLYTQD